MCIVCIISALDTQIKMTNYIPQVFLLGADHYACHMAQARKKNTPATPAPKKPRLSQAEATVRMLNATSQLLVENVPGEVTVVRICEAAGVHTDDVVRYFGSREELLCQSIEAAFQGIFLKTSGKETTRLEIALDGYLDIVKHFIDSKFWDGLYIVPILLLANVFLGITTNLSFWYKLSDRTNQAIWITGFGLLITLSVNFWLIPIMGFEGAAWATLASYVGMTVLSYILGQHYYPIPYKTGRILLVVSLAFVFGTLAHHFSMNNCVPQTAFFLAFMLILAWLERDVLQKLRAKIQSR